MYQEENDKMISPIILIITGIVAAILVFIFFFQVFTEKENNNEIAYLEEKNIEIIRS